MLGFLAKYGYLLVAAIIVLLFLVIEVIRFFKLSPKKQLEKVREWLLLVVMQAEQIYGAGTGEIKLRYAYEQFIEKFPDVAKVISFETFSGLVDDALCEFEIMLEDNRKLTAIVDAWRK